MHCLANWLPEASLATSAEWELHWFQYMIFMNVMHTKDAVPHSQTLRAPQLVAMAYGHRSRVPHRLARPLYSALVCCGTSLSSFRNNTSEP